MTAPVAPPRTISADEFRYIAGFLQHKTGIRLGPGKEPMVMGRLDRRLRHLGLSSYGEYFRYFQQPGNEQELRHAVDLLTTNETYFFRETPHFEFLRDVIVPERRGQAPLRVWSAASSSGEEAYTCAMVLADALPRAPWEIVGTDISSRMVDSSKRGLYPIGAAGKIPPPLLRKYCRRGTAEYEGLLAVSAELRARTTFLSLNLLDDLSRLGRFSVILLRNVMIYFDQETKAELIARLQAMLEPGGYLIVSHSETLNGFSGPLRLVSPSIYQLPADAHG